MVVNAPIAAMCKHGAAGVPESYLYQVGSSVVNPILIKELFGLFFEHFKSFPFIDSNGAPIHVPPMKLFTCMEDFANHLSREATDHGHAVVEAPRPQLSIRASDKLHRMCKKSMELAKYLANLYQPYTFYDARFDGTNTENLMKLMSAEEEMQFGFDMSKIDWRHYFLNVHIPGFSSYVMKGRLG